MEATTYISLFSEIKVRIREAQVKATLAANAQMIAMYWDIGKMIRVRQNTEGWGANIIHRLSIDIRNELPELKGFSERNLGRMLQFANEYSILPQPVAKLESIESQKDIIVQQPVAQLESQESSILPQAVTKFENEQLLLSIPWGHNLLLIEKIKDIENELSNEN